MQNLELIGGGIVVALVVGGILWVVALKRGKKKGSATSNALASNLNIEKAKADIILNSIADGVVVIDDQQMIRLFNPGASSITGFSREEAEGLDWRAIFKFMDAKGEVVLEENSPFRKAITAGQTVHDDKAILVSKSKNNVATTFSVSPLKEAEKTTGLVGIFRDVSQERAEETQRAEFISTASHEMRTPVAAIEGYLSLALNERVATVDTRAKEYLQKAHASTQHLGQLFQDLLTSAKAEDGRLTNHPQAIELGAFLEQLSEDLRFTAQKKNLFTEYIIGNNAVIDASSPIQAGSTAHPATVRPLYYAIADPDRLREVITNLFDNACKYTDQGKITLGLTGNDSIAQIYIRDTGHGIPPEDIGHLFQKFYRVDNSATRTIGGTGLGLFICRKIIELYQGRIWVESQVDKGSTFYINLPRLTSQRAEELIAQESGQGSPLAATTTAASASSTTPATAQTEVAA
ncbi:PAS domain-containing protein [Candidatus Saccharibacteria bacterium]|nr:MAG: PAS domain-containing protein [Candidatus Saccharibacteria bacterium]